MQFILISITTKYNQNDHQCIFYFFFLWNISRTGRKRDTTGTFIRTRNCNKIRKFMRHKSYNNVCIKEIDFSYIAAHKSLNDISCMSCTYGARRRHKRIVIIIKSHKNCIFRINAFIFVSFVCLDWIRQGKASRVQNFLCSLFIAFYSSACYKNDEGDHDLSIYGT